MAKSAARLPSSQWARAALDEGEIATLAWVRNDTLPAAVRPYS